MENAKKTSFRARRIIFGLILVGILAIGLIINPESYEDEVAYVNTEGSTEIVGEEKTAVWFLAKLEIKGRAPKTGYSRDEFYAGWPNVDGCSLRQKIIRREVGESAVMNGCDVVGGSFVESYTGQSLNFSSKAEISKGIQIDHVVALSDAWQKGAQNLSTEARYNIATDPLNLLAVDGKANQQKSDGDAATWLPHNKAFRCQYVARQISVKYKYGLWVTQAEHDAIVRVLEACPNEPVVGI